MARRGIPRVPLDRRAQRWAVTALFAVNGATFASWLPRLPDVRDRLGLELHELGLVLLGTGLGGLLASAAGGALVDRLGSRRASIAGAVALSLGLPLVATAGAPVALFGVLLGLGAVDVLTDIGMNVQGAQVQRRASGSVVQRFHGAWSVGSLGGAGVAAIAASAGVSLGWQLVATSAALLATVAVLAPHLSAVDDEPAPHPEGARRRPLLVLLAVLALSIAVVEGAPGEWAAVFAADVHGASAAVASVAFLAFSAGMVVGRFTGDAATDRLGAAAVFRWALGLAGAGLAVVASSPGAGVAIAGYAVVGLGVSVLFPALYLQAADTDGIPAGLGLGVMSTGARLGFLVSPLAVGGLASSTSLRLALAVAVGVAAVAALALEGVLRRSGRPREPAQR